MVRCSRRPTRDRRHAVRRGDFSLTPTRNDELLCRWGFLWWDNQAAFLWSRRITGVRAASAAQGRPTIRPPRRGCLDRPLIRRATLRALGSRLAALGREAAHSMWSPRRLPYLSAPALSEPKARSRVPTRRLCDGVRRRRPTSCRPPEHPSRQTRSAAAASFARCIIEDIDYRQSGGARSGGFARQSGGE